ncbi:hypothetical protein CRE_02221 [Caenorhabditis remanei]|uniref:Uncharacterized protein n=1 Tax=Caenorhabditis remanei TaxID=31234 RepID=E3LFQ9_CAERE|nr:hypothetical protein CRE_02221 [Caenorhabditis remanei]
MFGQCIPKTADPVEIEIKYAELCLLVEKEQQEHEETKNKLVDKDVELNAATEFARIATEENRTLQYDRQMMFRNIAAIKDRNRVNAIEYNRTINSLREKLLDVDKDARAPLLELNAQKDAEICELENTIEEMRKHNPVLQELQIINELRTEHEKDKEEIKNLNEKMNKVRNREVESNERFHREIAERDAWIQSLLHYQEPEVEEDFKENYQLDANQQHYHSTQNNLQEQQLYQRDVRCLNELNQDDEQLARNFGNQLCIDDAQFAGNNFHNIQ